MSVPRCFGTFSRKQTGAPEPRFAAPVAARCGLSCDPPPRIADTWDEATASLEGNQAAHLIRCARAAGMESMLWPADGCGTAWLRNHGDTVDSTWSRGHSGSRSAGHAAALCFQVRSHGVAIEKVTDWGPSASSGDRPSQREASRAGRSGPCGALAPAGAGGIKAGATVRRPAH